MSDKRQQATAAGWVSPVAVQSENTQGHAPTHKGEISNWRVGVFFVLALAVALALAWLAMTWGTTPAVAVFVVALLVVFTPFYLIDSVLSSGYWHERARLIVEDNKTFAAVQTASQVNAEQQAAISQLWKANQLLDERLKAVETIRVQDNKGVRYVAKHDEFDMAIDSWLSQTMFDANGVLVGTHSNGQIKTAFPFRTKDDRGQQCYARLVAAQLVGKRGSNYTWTGPQSLVEALQWLAPGRGKTAPIVE